VSTQNLLFLPHLDKLPLSMTNRSPSRIAWLCQPGKSCDPLNTAYAFPAHFPPKSPVLSDLCGARALVPQPTPSFWCLAVRVVTLLFASQTLFSPSALPLSHTLTQLSITDTITFLLPLRVAFERRSKKGSSRVDRYSPHHAQLLEISTALQVLSSQVAPTNQPHLVIYHKFCARVSQYFPRKSARQRFALSKLEDL
jgi:hypothetical protein